MCSVVWVYQNQPPNSDHLDYFLVFTIIRRVSIHVYTYVYIYVSDDFLMIDPWRWN